MSPLQLTILLLVEGALGAAFGYAIGRMQHHMFLMDGFKYLASVVRGNPASADEPSVSAIEVSRAFGSRRAER